MRFASSAASRRGHWARPAVVALSVAAMLIAPGAAAAGQKPAANPAVITTWNAFAVATIAGPPPNGLGKANAEAFIWFSFVHAAMYNAVEGITREYALYKWDRNGPREASPEAAAAAAAHRILMTYFGSNPTIASNLDSALASSLALIPDGRAKTRGIHYGERAANHLIAQRANDGRFAPIVFDLPVPSPIGRWVPTPPANAPMLDPWLGFVQPLVVKSLGQFRPGPPPAIGSNRYLRDFNEVRDYGGSTGSLRTPEQTKTALFFYDIAVGALQASMRDLVTRRHLDISDSARLFAAVDLSLADTIGTVWRAKYRYGFWRPITAIARAADDGDPRTVGVAGWTPFLVTPPYPEWPSGLNSVVAAASTALSRLNDDGHIDLFITSVGAGETRHYMSATAMQHDAVNARVWTGIHVRTADEAGRRIGIKVANWALDHYFRPLD